MIDDNAAPTPRPGVDFSSLSPSPTPEQFFLLSRLDGKLTVGELCKISGLGRQKTLEAIESLARSGAIDVPGLEVEIEASEASEPSGAQSPSSPSSSDEDASKKSSSKSDKKSKSSAKKGVVPNYPVPPEEFEFDADLLEADVPLDEQRRKEVICLHDQMGQMSFYDLFGLAPDAGRKDIKKAYFRLSKRYHPDKFFRKEMDAFGPMIETIFKEITKAYRTLSNKRKRADYDAELAAHPVAEASAHQAPSSAAEDDAHASPDASEQNKRKAAAVLLMRRAEKLQAREKYQDAAAEYRKALALNRDGDLALQVARMLLDEAQMAEEAGSFARAAMKLGADAASVHFLLGQTYEAMGTEESAVEHYRKALVEAPEHEQAQARLEELSAHH